MVWRTLRKWFPDAKWVVIDRRFDDVLKSCSDIEPACRDNLKLMKCHLDCLIAEIHPMVVNFQDIDPIWSYRVSQYLGIGIGPATRVRQLCDMNIQIHPPVLKQRLENLRVSTIVDTEKTAA
jgi:predicted P-loop ATPase/GTPase